MKFVAERAISTNSINTDHCVLNEREFNESTRISRQDAKLVSGVLSRRDGDGNFIFIIFRDRPLFRAREIAPRNTRHVLTTTPRKSKSYVSLRNRSMNVTRDIPRSREFAMFRHRFIIVVRLEIFALSKSARFFFGYRSDRAGRAL